MVYVEIWKSVKNYEGYYEVSNLGNVRSIERVVILKDKCGNDRPCIYKSKELKQSIETKERYNWKPRKYVRLSKGGNIKRFYVHRLVAETFIENKECKAEVNHKDGNPFNNNVKNLEWNTKKENIDHAFKNNLIKTQKRVAQLDKTTNEIIKIYASESEACRQMKVTQGKILRSMHRNGTCNGYRWKYI